MSRAFDSVDGRRAANRHMPLRVRVLVDYLVDPFGGNAGAA